MNAMTGRRALCVLMGSSRAPRGLGSAKRPVGI